MMKIHYPLVFLFACCLSLVACGVNEMPQYRDQIATVQLSSSIRSSAEVVFASPDGGDPGDPDDVAVMVMEDRIRERLAERVERLANPGLLSGTFSDSLVRRVPSVFPWSVAESRSSSDAFFQIEIDRYGVEVDSEGVATAFFDMDIRGYFGETGLLIYEDSLTSRMTMTEIYQGHDPVSDAAARTLNLLALDELSDARFQELIMEAGHWSVEDLLDELFEDTYDD